MTIFGIILGLIGIIFLVFSSASLVMWTGSKKVSGLSALLSIGIVLYIIGIIVSIIGNSYEEKRTEKALLEKYAVAPELVEAIENHTKVDDEIVVYGCCFAAQNEMALNDAIKMIDPSLSDGMIDMIVKESDEAQLKGE